MEQAIFFSTFGLIFLAELGDKTQLTAMALALRYPWQRIFVGIAAAFIVLNLAAVAVGKVLFLLLPIFWVTLVSALLFLYFGYSTLRHACDSEDDDGGPPFGQLDGDGHGLLLIHAGPVVRFAAGDLCRQTAGTFYSDLLDSSHGRIHVPGFRGCRVVEA